MDDLGAHTHERLRPSPVAPVSRRLAVAVGRPAPPTCPRRSGFSRDPPCRHRHCALKAGGRGDARMRATESRMQVRNANAGRPALAHPPRRSGFSRDRGDTGPRGHQEQNRTASALAVRCGSRPSDAPKGRAGADQDETWDPAASRPGIAAL